MEADELRRQLHDKELELERLQGELRDARMAGIAVGVLLARWSPGTVPAPT